MISCNIQVKLLAFNQRWEGLAAMYWLTGDFQSCCLPGICFHLSSDTLTENTVYKQTWVDQKRLRVNQAHIWQTDEPWYFPCHFLYLSLILPFSRRMSNIPDKVMFQYSQLFFTTDNI